MTLAQLKADRETAIRKLTDCTADPNHRSAEAERLRCVCYATWVAIAKVVGADKVDAD
jgi:hypothetical protein